MIAILTHGAVVLNILFSGEQAMNSPMDTELTGDLPMADTPNVESPPTARTMRRTGRTNVRRNLLPEFDREFPNRNIDDATTRNANVQMDGWGSFVKYWLLIISVCVIGIYNAYRYLPGYVLLSLTREVLVYSVLVISIIVVISAVVKVCKDRSIPIHSDVTGSVVSATGPTRISAVSVPVKRTFKGDGTDVWSEFIRYFENVASLNAWLVETKRRVLLSSFRGQAEAFAYGLPDNVLMDYVLLIQNMDDRFGHKAMKESYIAEAKLRKKLKTESFRDFGQAIADLYRRAHPSNRDYVEEASLKTFMDNCSDEEDFRLAVKRTRPKSLQEAVTSAMQEECIRMTENTKVADRKVFRPVYDVREFNKLGRQPRKQVLNNDRNEKKCYACDSTEHLYRDCPSRRNNVSNRKRDQPLNGDRPRQ